MRWPEQCRRVLPLFAVFGLAACAATGGKPGLDPSLTPPPNVAANGATPRPSGAAPKPQKETSSPSQSQTAADMTVYFPTGIAQLSPEALDSIRAIADQLRTDRRQDAELTSRARFVGSRSLCLALAAQRLSAVAEKLVQLGARADQLRQKNMSCDNAKIVQAACTSRVCNDPEERVELRLLR